MVKSTGVIKRLICIYELKTVHKLRGQSGSLPGEIIRHNQGSKIGQVRAIKIQHTQVHHLIPRELKDHEIWRLSGMDVLDDSNSIALPTVKGAELSELKCSIHQGRQLSEVTKNLKKEINDLAEEGIAANWNQSQFKEELLDVIAEEKQKVLSGERKLNKNCQPHADNSDISKHRR